MIKENKNSDEGVLIISVTDLVKDNVKSVCVSKDGIRFEYEDGCFKELGEVGGMYNEKKAEMKDKKKQLNMIEDTEIDTTNRED